MHGQKNFVMIDKGTVRNMQFYSKNTFEKLVHLDGFIIGIYYDARSPERQTDILIYIRIILGKKVNK